MSKPEKLYSFVSDYKPKSTIISSSNYGLKRRFGNYTLCCGGDTLIIFINHGSEINVTFSAETGLEAILSE